MNKIVPDYVRIRTYIIGLIAASRSEELERIPTERELCKTFATSRTTLRKALQQLEEEGYLIRKSYFGTFINKDYRSMVDFHTRKHKVVGIVLGNGELTFLPSYHMRVLSQILARLADEDCCGRLVEINGNAEKEFDFLLNNHQFDAFLFIEPPGALISCVDKFKAHRIPLVVSRIHDIETIDYCVFSDSSQGAYLVTDYLLKTGHRRILFLENADMSHPVNELRKAGAMAAFVAHGVEWNEALWHCALPVNTAEKIDHICNYGQEFTAVFTADPFYELIREKLTDRPAVPVIRIAANKSDREDSFQIVAPSGAMGKEAGELICQLLDVPYGSIPPRHIKIDFELSDPPQG